VGKGTLYRRFGDKSSLAFALLEEHELRLQQGSWRARHPWARVLRPPKLGMAADKIVYSKTLETVSSVKTRIERDFDPEAVRQMKAPAGRDITAGGPDLAAQAIKAGLVDECHLFVAPIVVGGGKQSLPNNVRLKLELLDERRFGNGVVHLHYRTRT
jgi:dihydrofolate reductase